MTEHFTVWVCLSVCHCQGLLAYTSLTSWLCVKLLTEQRLTPCQLMPITDHWSAVLCSLTPLTDTSRVLIEAQNPNRPVTLSIDVFWSPHPHSGTHMRKMWMQFNTPAFQAGPGPSLLVTIKPGRRLEGFLCHRTECSINKTPLLLFLIWHTLRPPENFILNS